MTLEDLSKSKYGLATSTKKILIKFAAQHDIMSYNELLTCTQQLTGNRVSLKGKLCMRSSRNNCIL